MVVFSNQRLGPGAELLVSDQVATEILRATAAAAAPFAEARWELELVRWLERRACGAPVTDLDVSEIAWTPDHFGMQQRFLLDAIRRASESGEHPAAFERWKRLIEAHPAESVQVRSLWNWQPSA